MSQMDWVDQHVLQRIDAMISDEPNRLLTVTESAELAEYDRSAIRHALAKGALAGTKIGKQWVISPQALRDWLCDWRAHKTGKKV